MILYILIDIQIIKKQYILMFSNLTCFTWKTVMYVEYVEYVIYLHDSFTNCKRTWHCCQRYGALLTRLSFLDPSLSCRCSTAFLPVRKVWDALSKTSSGSRQWQWFVDFKDLRLLVNWVNWQEGVDLWLQKSMGTARSHWKF